MTEERKNVDSSPLLTAGLTVGAAGLGGKMVYDKAMNIMATDKVEEILKQDIHKSTPDEMKMHFYADDIEDLYKNPVKGEKPFIGGAKEKLAKAQENLTKAKAETIEVKAKKGLPPVDINDLPANPKIKKAEEAIEAAAENVQRVKAQGVVEGLELTKNKAFIETLKNAHTKAAFIAAIGGLGAGAAVYFAKNAMSSRPQSFAEREMQRRGGQAMPEVS